ncbi:MAG TPA: amidohydrolase [Planctomycetaceae bacterium]|nr:amidohydrolase [Planctomycetaceae bacterium]|tara:strand:- start:1309 stop:2820 length:1512 start_codon:yes stop_codon:yes gene_type:complete
MITGVGAIMSCSGVGSMKRSCAAWLVLVVACGVPAVAQDGAKLSKAQRTAVADVQERMELIKEVNRKIWNYAEVGLEETRSSKLLQQHLKENGFKVKNGVAAMPTAFVASYGSGKPVIGILAEYDALPGMSQKAESVRSPLKPGQPGHACGHSGLGSGALGAALAVKAAMDRHKIKGTIRLYGTPAEETVIGKVYMLLDGQFDDLDICLHWHPSTRNGAWAGTSKALVSVKFTFDGTAAHASGNPESGRSALDAVELMNVGVNYMREHVKEDARMHYVITNGGGAPNVVPPIASVWYYIRADDHRDVEANFKWIQDIARGAALMTRTKMRMKVDTDCHELIPNVPLAELIEQKLKVVGPPRFDQSEKAFARRLQQPLIEQFGTEFPKAIDESIRPFAESMTARTRGSTDVGDISWYVPTGGISTACLAAKSPGHSWQNVAAIGSTIGEKGIIYASKVLAISAIELFEDPDRVAAARVDWEKRMEKRKYTTLIPKGQKPPVKIR